MENKHIRSAKKTEEIRENIFKTIQWHDNISVLDLSNRDISRFDENIELPPSLLVLNLSKNKFLEIPQCVIKLQNLQSLDFSHNNIVLFDDKPNFIKSLECLNLCYNNLEGPPAWIWCEKTNKALQIDLSNNENICKFKGNQNLEDLLHYTTLVNRIILHSCRISKDVQIMTTFMNAKEVILGSMEYNYYSVNRLETIPCPGLEDCCDIEILDLCNTYIYDVQNNIDIYQNLIEINLSQNNINGLPNEFCNLKNLEICILSGNKILYLPDHMHKLTKLTKLYLDNNELCMLPDNFHLIEGLKILDLYNNRLYEGMGHISNLEQYDFAQNYGNEPQDKEYYFKREQLRQNTSRLDGRLPEACHIENDDYEEDERSFEDDDDHMSPETQVTHYRCSSPEDWDSDNYWIPSPIDIDIYATPLYRKRPSNNSQATMHWINFVKRKMKEGNFCPIDMHMPVSITDTVKYEKMYNPVAQYESDGQFDDYSDDDT